MSFKGEGGAILIITLWILVILTILSVGVAGRVGLELKLTGFYRDSFKALYLAKAGINRAIVEKEKDNTPNADILNESWANNEKLFKDFKFIETENSTYTIKYAYKESLEAEGVDLYGMMDEASKININMIVAGDTVDQVRKGQLVNLLEIVCGLDELEATAKVDALIDWIDTNDTVQGSAEKENTKYYGDIGVDTYSKNSSLESIGEILLINGFDSTILYGNKEQEKNGLIDYITIYTESGKVNVNTTPKEVLQALGFTSSQADDIINYRKNGGEVGSEENQAIIELNDLTDGTIPYTVGLTAEDIANITNNIIPYLSLTSNTFRIYAKGKVNRVEKLIDCVVKVESDKYPEFKYWNENYKLY